MRHNKTHLALAALLLLAACRTEPRPDDVLDPETMAAVMADAYLLEGYNAVETEYRFDTLSPRVMQAYDDLLARHGVDREALGRSLAYYTTHPEHYRPIMDSTLARIDRSEAATAADTLSLPNPVALD